jgi:hypothetical protein
VIGSANFLSFRYIWYGLSQSHWLKRKLISGFVLYNNITGGLTPYGQWELRALDNEYSISGFRTTGEDTHELRKLSSALEIISLHAALFILSLGAGSMSLTSSTIPNHHCALSLVIMLEIA